MNKRARCQQCLRPPVACLCHTIKTIDNQVKLVILQHPSEVKHAKGTAKIVELTLNNSEVIIGEDFSNDQVFNAMIKERSGKIMLLYPHDNAISPSQLKNRLNGASGAQGQDESLSLSGLTLTNLTIVVLDGSWKKAYKMFCLNPALQALPCIGIDVNNQSNYRIRKSSRSDSLSTIEACYQLLSELEGEQTNFGPLLDSFDFMVDYQLNAMPSDIRARYTSG
jgi:tRNA-uridine aminocarboxypropyltransferase